MQYQLFLSEIKKIIESTGSFTIGNITILPDEPELAQLSSDPIEIYVDGIPE